MYAKWCVILFVLVFGVGAFGSATVPVAAQDQAVDPVRGVPGTPFAFYATAFSPRSNVAFWGVDPTGREFGASNNQTKANNEGRADWVWVAPPDAMPGTWTMVAQQFDGTGEDAEPVEGRLAQISFEVLPPGDAAAVPATEDPGVQGVNPQADTPGSQFTFFANGFKRLEHVGFWFNAPNGEVYTNEPEFITYANDAGRADWSWSPPPTAPVGLWQAVAQGKESGVQRAIFFTLVAPENAAPQPVPEGAVEPTVGEPDQTLAFVASGFEPREWVSFWAISPGGSTDGKDSYRVRANNDGRADWFWKVPRNGEPGMWQMVAFGNDSEVTRVIRFEVVPCTQDCD